MDLTNCLENSVVGVQKSHPWSMYQQTTWMTYDNCHQVELGRYEAKEVSGMWVYFIIFAFFVILTLGGMYLLKDTGWKK